MVGDTINMGKLSFHRTSESMKWYLHNPVRRRDWNSIQPISRMNPVHEPHGLFIISKNYTTCRDAMMTSRTTILTNCDMGDISNPGQRGIDLDWDR